MERYTSSLAGYCLITYILDIGDRHFDNILLKESGEIFHVDFSFAFGKDPKPFKCRMRITMEMITAMGGLSSPLYERFLVLICAGFQVLRKNSSMLMHVLTLMMEANITDLTVRQKGPEVMASTLELLQLHLSEEEANRYIRNVVSESLNAVMPSVLERMHRLANSFR